MAARRPYWKGYLTLSMVTCTVALYPASSPGRVVDKENKGHGIRPRSCSGVHRLEGCEDRRMAALLQLVGALNE